MFSIKEILDLAVKLEKNGKTFYRQASEKSANPEVRSLLEWLAGEEVRHEEWFSEMLRRVAQKGTNPEMDEMDTIILREILGDQSFSLKEADLTTLEKMEDLIQLAIEFENDTILFYEMIQPVIEDEQTLRHLREIIDEEQRHVQLLRECLQKEGIGISERAVK
jgi:rubrerythrin